MIDKKHLLSIQTDGGICGARLLALRRAWCRTRSTGLSCAASTGKRSRDIRPARLCLQCYHGTPIRQLLDLPQIQGLIASLVGEDPLFDHDAIHVREPNEGKAQGLHADSIIDCRTHFDIQLMYFPHDVPLEMGGTLLLARQPLPAHQRDGCRRLPEYARADPHGLQSRFGAGAASRHLALRPPKPDRPPALYVQAAPEPGRAAIAALEYRRPDR